VEVVSQADASPRRSLAGSFRPASWSVGRIAVTGALLVGLGYGLVSLLPLSSPPSVSQKTAPSPDAAASSQAVPAPSADPPAASVESADTPLPKDTVPVVVAAAEAPSAMAAPVPALAPVAVAAPVPAAPKTQLLKTVADCREAQYSFPVVTPSYVSKETPYIFIKSSVAQTLCVAADDGDFRLLALQGDKGLVVNGESAWRIISHDIKKLDLFVQGVKLRLDPSVVNAVQVVKKR